MPIGSRVLGNLNSTAQRYIIALQNAVITRFNAITAPWDCPYLPGTQFSYKLRLDTETNEVFIHDITPEIDARRRALLGTLFLNMSKEYQCPAEFRETYGRYVEYNCYFRIGG